MAAMAASRVAISSAPGMAAGQAFRRLGLEAGEHLVDLADVARRERRDAQAARRARLQEPLGLQADQRLPHRGAGGAERQGELRLQHLGAGGEAAIDDPGLDRLVQRVTSEGSVAFVFRQGVLRMQETGSSGAGRGGRRSGRLGSCGGVRIAHTLRASNVHQETPVSMTRLLVLPGDGIGPEITAATLEVLRAADARFGLGLAFETMEIGFASLKAQGTTLPDAVLAAARASDGIILGPISHLDYPPRDKGGINVSAAFRVGLDLYANVRPARTRPGLGRGHAPLDLVIMREATEGFYPDRNMFAGTGEFMPTPDVAMSVRKITAHASTRIARRAFELARRRRRKVTAVHKANTFILTDGLWLRCVREVAKEFPRSRSTRSSSMPAPRCWCATPRASTCWSPPTSTPTSSPTWRPSSRAGSASRQHERERASLLRPGAAWQRARHRGPGQGEPDLADPLGGDAAGVACAPPRQRRAGEAAAAISAAVDAALADPATRTPDLGGRLGTRAFGERLAGMLRG
jgi:3-isopropylmalate dehydrogenase